MAPPSGPGLLLISVLGVLALDRFARSQRTGTLIFTKEDTTRNCSCPTEVRDCDYGLASLLCSCRTAQPPAPAERASYRGRLAVWFTDPSALGPLLSLTLVRDLKLSLCGASTLPTGYLAICGLERLRVTAEARRPALDHSLVIQGQPVESPALRSGWDPCAHVSFLDMALFNRESAPRAYTVQNVANFSGSFPSFPGFEAFPLASSKSYFVTFIY